MKIGFFAIMLLLIAVPAAAKSGQMELLAVSQLGNGTYTGGLADLYLEVLPGNDRVFMETFPLSKLDTQMSTRFAKEIACYFVDKNCAGSDFFYTITASSSTIGGPSAGAAIAVLTVIVIEDLEFRDDVAITGTINSGGMIGSVGAVREKIEGAASNSIKTVLIPKGSAIIEEDNQTIDVIQYGKDRGIEVKEVATLGEAVYEFTGVDYTKNRGPIEISPMYTETMSRINADLCNRTDMLMATYLSEHTGPLNDTLYISAVNKTAQSKVALDNERFYSSASYCFGANIFLRYLVLKDQEPDEYQIYDMLEVAREQISVFDDRVDERKRETITDLQTYIVVKERTLDSRDSLEKAARELKDNNSNAALYDLAYTLERLHSAQFWSYFFGTGTKTLELNNDSLMRSCNLKLREAEERITYLEQVLPIPINETRKELAKAYADSASQRYELCLFRASSAKAQADAYLGMMSIHEDKLKDVIEDKLNLTKEVIYDQQEKGNFPILGYSYYEYARDLMETQPYSSFIYNEYALEFSNLDLYFREESMLSSVKYNVSSRYVAVLLIGIIIGLISATLFFSFREISFKKKLDKYYKKKYSKK